MDVLLRESAFGRILNYVSDNKLFPAPDPEIPKSDVSANPSSSAAASSNAVDHILIDFNGPDDPDMPRNWPMLAKTVVMIDVMLLNFSFYAASAIFTPSIPKIEEVFGATTAEGTLGLSLFVIAYGIGPLIVCLDY
jgi:DHA1 family multidrug resistance protein-like MFS transporter